MKTRGKKKNVSKQFLCYYALMYELKKEVANTMKRLYDRKLTTATGGNVSLRYKNIMLITPSGLDKANLTPELIAEVDIETGENKTPHLKLSIESSMHRLIYVKNPEVMAVCHSHPTKASLFSALKEEIRVDLIAESWFLLGAVKKVPYALMGSEKLAQLISDAAKTDCCLLLSKHGALTTGKTLLNAFDRLECLEQAAEMTLLSKGFTIDPLTKEERDEIDRVYKRH